MPELILVALLLITIAAAGWIAVDARKRGLAPVPWAVMTLILPPIGIVLYLLRVLVWQQPAR